MVKRLGGYSYIVHTDASVNLGYSNTDATGMVPRPKLLATLSSDEMSVREPTNFISAPHNIASSMVFLPTGTVISMCIVFGVVDMSAIDFSNLLMMVDGVFPFPCNSFLKHSICWGSYGITGMVSPVWYLQRI